MSAGLVTRCEVAAVPFEAPALLGTRVREENSDRVAMLHDFARGTSATYVLPWKDLPKLTPLLGFDGDLHQRVRELEKISPRSIQKAAQKLRVLGAAGPEAQTEELQRRQAERRRYARVSATLARSLILTLYPDQGTTTVTKTPRLSLQRACELCGLRPGSVGDDLGKLAEIIGPAGLGDQMQKMTAGPLRQITGQIGEFARHCRFRSDRLTSDQDERKYYQLAEEAASAAQLAATRSLSLIDNHLRDLKATLVHWETRRPSLEAAVTHLEDVLDGWESVLGLHAGLWEAPSPRSMTRAASIWTLLQDLPGRSYWSQPVSAPGIQPASIREIN